MFGTITFKKFEGAIFGFMSWPTRKQWLVLIPCALMLGHFFVSLGRTETFTDLITQKWYYIDIAFVSTISFVILFYCVMVHNSLDTRMPLREMPTMRLIWQVGIGVLIPAFLSFLLTFAYMYFILNQDIRSGTFFVYEFPISIVVIFTTNLVLIVFSLWLVPQPEISKAITTTILASQGNRTVPLPIRSIATFSKEGDHYLITTFDLQQYVSPHHLEELELMVASRDFFRANRQVLIHRAACGHFTTDRAGKLTLHLSIKPDQPISISQKRAAEFRSWLAQ
jgi:LytTr DNA-binding domain